VVLELPRGRYDDDDDDDNDYDKMMAVMAILIM
jgi:hypothetical protein